MQREAAEKNKKKGLYGFLLDEEHFSLEEYTEFTDCLKKIENLDMSEQEVAASVKKLNSYFDREKFSASTK